MRFAINSASCIPVDMKNIFNIFRPEVLVQRFLGIKKELSKKSNINNIELSFHPMRVMATKTFMGLFLEGIFDISSLDFPDVVGFFDKRMLSEFSRKQTVSQFLDRQKAHVGWRLLNVPSYMEAKKQFKYIQSCRKINLIRISSKMLEETFIFDILKDYNGKISFEIDSFQYKMFDSFILGIRLFNKELKRKRNFTGISLDAAHLLQGQAMGVCGPPEKVLEEIKESGIPVFSVDYNPVEILDQKRYESGEVEQSEVIMDEVIKLHSHPERNVFEYPLFLEKVLEYFSDTLEEIVIELNPMDLDNPGERFFQDLKDMQNICRRFDRC